MCNYDDVLYVLQVNCTLYCTNEHYNVNCCNWLVVIDFDKKNIFLADARLQIEKLHVQHAYRVRKISFSVAIMQSSLINIKWTWVVLSSVDYLLNNNHVTSQQVIFDMWKDL